MKPLPHHRERFPKFAQIKYEAPIKDSFSKSIASLFEKNDCKKKTFMFATTTVDG